MFNTTNCGYSLSDIAAVTGNNRSNDGFFGEDGWWIILLFLFAGGWGNGFGNGFGGYNGGSTVREEISYGFDMNGLESGVRGIQQGLCDGFYAVNTGMLNGFNGVQSTLCQGFAGVNDAITQSTIADMQNMFGLSNAITAGNTALTAQLTNMAAADAACCCELKGAIKDNATQSVFNTNAIQTQIANCCCDIEKANMQNRFDAQTNTNSTLLAIDRLGDRIIGFMADEKLQTLRDENQALRFAASQAEQNAFITANQTAQTAELIRRLGKDCPVPAYVVPNPNCCYNVNLTSGCGGCAGYAFN